MMHGNNYNVGFQEEFKRSTNNEFQCDLTIPQLVPLTQTDMNAVSDTLSSFSDQHFSAVFSQFNSSDKQYFQNSTHMFENQLMFNLGSENRQHVGNRQRISRSLPIDNFGHYRASPQECYPALAGQNVNRHLSYISRPASDSNLPQSENFDCNDRAVLASLSPRCDSMLSFAEMPNFQFLNITSEVNPDISLLPFASLELEIFHNYLATNSLGSISLQVKTIELAASTSSTFTQSTEFFNNDFRMMENQLDCKTAVNKKDNAATSVNQDKKVYKLVRHSELTKRFHKESEVEECRDIILKFSGLIIDDVDLEPWSVFENMDGRKIVRIERIQDGCNIQAKFKAVDANLPSFQSKGGTNALEVSCLKFVCHDNRAEYYITSVEVLKIVDLLTGSRETDKKRRRFERARIRSNLLPFWKKNFLEEITNGENEDKLRRMFVQRTMYYRRRKPIDVLKDVRFMPWSFLVPALERAMLFFRVVIPDSDYEATQPLKNSQRDELGDREYMEVQRTFKDIYKTTST